MPTTDGAIVTYINAFAATVAVDPAKYFMSPADSASLSAAATNLSNAYAAQQVPGASNELLVIAKNEALDAAVGLVRLHSLQIKYNMGISTDDKAALGISQPNPARTSRNVPPEQPLLGIVGSLTGSQTLTFSVPGTESRAKPVGAQTLELRVAISEEVVTDPNLAKPVGLFAKNPIGVAFEPEDNKKTATYFGRWANVRGQVGPWSNPVSMTIAA